MGSAFQAFSQSRTLHSRTPSRNETGRQLVPAQRRCTSELLVGKAHTHTHTLLFPLSFLSSSSSAFFCLEMFGRVSARLPERARRPCAAVSFVTVDAVSNLSRRLVFVGMATEPSPGDCFSVAAVLMEGVIEHWFGLQWTFAQS